MCEENGIANDVFRLLSPKGPLFNSVLVHFMVDPTIRYDIPCQDIGLSAAVLGRFGVTCDLIIA